MLILSPTAQAARKLGATYFRRTSGGLRTDFLRAAPSEPRRNSEGSPSEARGNQPPRGSRAAHATGRKGRMAKVEYSSGPAPRGRVGQHVYKRIYGRDFVALAGHAPRSEPSASQLAARAQF